MSKKILSLVLLILTSLSLSAQSTSSSGDTDFGIWQYISATKSLNNKFTLLLRLEHRSKHDAKDLDCGLVMPGIIYRPTSWLQIGFIYDFAMAQNNTHRNVLLPYITASKKAGAWSFTYREMGQYILENDNFLLRSKLEIRYRIPNTVISPFIAIEPYTNSNQVTKVDCDNALKNAAQNIGVVRSTNLAGLAFSLNKKSTLEVGYSYYYLGVSNPARHLLNVGYSIRL